LNPEDLVDEAFEGGPVGDGEIALEDDPVKAGEHSYDQTGKLAPPKRMIRR
jgi:hypothetical protein